MPGIDAVLEHLKRDEPAALARLFEWLRIPSISTLSAHKADTRRAAEWAAANLRESGFAVELRDIGTPRGSGHPIVWATTPGGGGGGGGPHILFYGHYDVQPADPVELWDSGPFEPVIKPKQGEVGERIVCRGACDDKGQVAMFLDAVRAWKLAGGKVAGGVRFSVLLEGEEESGSVNLDAYLGAHAEELRACDVCLISDTGMLSRTQPAITYGVRGLVYTEVTLHGPDQDLHSGLWGGRCPNPNSELVKVLARLWDADRRITIPGFYDAVRPLTPGEREAWKKLPFNQSEELAKIGLPPEADVGEKGFTAMEREWARPTAEINGIVGGYTGPGAKTVIPAHASAKVSFRLVADQDPETIRDAFFAWCKANTPPGCRWEFHDHSGGNGVTLPTDSKYLQAASGAIEKATGKRPVLIKSGGSIPVAGSLKAIAGLDTIFMGFGLNDDRIHSPNEKFELECYRMGARSHALFIDALANMRG
ncbi:MAG TPA: M20/M25/M40 family metallo-hydrolase [Phycisphaerales bacterium]|nr:M20/M25/M40 family metallo-hydrolase [Phycisphaerales bacterium]